MDGAMITSILLGGAGNQLHQLAFGLAQARRLNTQLQLDISRLGGYRLYTLDQWDKPGCWVTTPWKSQPTVREASLSYNKTLVDSIKDGDILEGYWQTEKYTTNILSDLMNLRPRVTNYISDYQIFKAKNSVAVHVRRGDYLTEPHKSFHGNLGREYYKIAMDYVRERVEDPTFFIFTDDPDWVRESWYTDFSLGREAVLDPGVEAADIFSMSLCEHAIIANSSFSWWGAWLGGPRAGRIVIAPKNWFAPAANQDDRDIVPERWVRL
jgi:hypothetical protein